jgi:hypothetical protein
MVAFFLGLNSPDVVRISASTASHDDYGLMYPATYVFDIPAGASGLKAWRKFASGDAFVEMTEKTSDDFFNGIEAVRFDYVNKKAYISIAFSATSDDIYLKVTNAGGEIVGSWSQVANYYDNRQCTVCASLDEYSGGTQPTMDERTWMESVNEAVDDFQSRSIWVTTAIATQNNSWEYEATPAPPTWSEIQAQIDEGFLEVASHSRWHTNPMSEFTVEINGSKTDILANLTLPYAKGATQYLLCWISPAGQTSAGIQAQLGASKYLCYVAGNFESGLGWQNWTVDGVYNSWNGRRYIEGSTAATLNADFDTAYTNGEIYALRGHPDRWSWTEFRAHLDYIKLKKDVWYVGKGAMYLYRYIAEDVIAYNSADEAYP